MIEKNRDNEVILEMVEALKNKNFEFPRAHKIVKEVNICILIMILIYTVL